MPPRGPSLFFLSLLLSRIPRTTIPFQSCFPSQGTTRDSLSLMLPGRDSHFNLASFGGIICNIAGHLPIPRAPFFFYPVKCNEKRSEHPRRSRHVHKHKFLTRSVFASLAETHLAASIPPCTRRRSMSCDFISCEHRSSHVSPLVR